MHAHPPGSPLAQRYLELPAELYKPWRPAPLPEPVLAAASPAALHELAALGPDPLASLVNWAGGALPVQAQPVACVYGGHQFGVYVPQLGDGRALLLGDVPDAATGRLEVQLKGAGPTPYARGADGRLGLTAALREFLMCEALAGLGIPTARVPCVLSSALPLARTVVEPAAVLVRTAPGFMRFGTLEYAYWRGRPDWLLALTAFAQRHYFPELAEHPQALLALFEAVARRGARLLGLWQAYGFVHGVLNTDNQTLLGLTLDIGPTAFVEAFDPHHHHNASDVGGRYVYAHQSAVGLWNLRALAHALGEHLPADAAAGVLDSAQALCLEVYGAQMRARLGLSTARPEDADLVDALLSLLARAGADYPAFLRRLGDWSPASPPARDALLALGVDAERLDDWLVGYARRLSLEPGTDAQRRQRMHAVNPLYVLRAQPAEQAFAAAREGHYGLLERMRSALAAPFAEQPGMDDLSAPAPAGSAAALSCLT